MPGLSLKIGADISDAQAALKTVVSDSQAAASKVSSAFGRTQLPLQNITQYNAAINSLKQNISSVKFSLPPLPTLPKGITTDLNLNTENVSAELKSITSEVQKTAGKVVSIFSGVVLPTSGITNYSNSVTALKQNINSVDFSKLTAVPKIPPIRLVVDNANLSQQTNAAIQSISRLQSSIDVLKTRAAGTTKLLSVETDIVKADQLSKEIALLNSEISVLSNRSKSLSGISFGNLNLPLNNIAQYNQAVTTLKQNISTVTFKPLPPLPKLTEVPKLAPIPLAIDVTKANLSLQSVVANAEKTRAELVSVFRNAVLPTTTIDRYSASITALKQNIDTVSFSKLANVPAVTVPVKVDKVLPQEISINTGSAIANLQQLNSSVKTSEAEIEKLKVVSAQPLSTSGLTNYSASVTALKNNVATAKIIPVLPSFDASSLSLTQAISQLDKFHRALANATDPSAIKLYEETIASLETHIERLNALKSGKPLIDLSGVQAQVAPASAAISQLVTQIEVLRSKALEKLQLLSTETDIGNIKRLEAEINVLLAEITRISNIPVISIPVKLDKIPVQDIEAQSQAAVSKVTSVFSKPIPLNTIITKDQFDQIITEGKITESKLQAVFSVPIKPQLDLTEIKNISIPPLSSPPKIKVDADVKDAETGIKSLIGVLDTLESQGKLSIGGVEDALKQFKRILSVTTDPKDINKLNGAIEALKIKLTDLKSTGVDQGLHGISTGTRRASSSLLNLSHTFDVLPPKVAHVAHSFDQLFNVYEQIRSESTSAGSALKKFGSLLAGPVGLGLAVSVGVSLLAQFGAKLFEASEKTKLAEEATNKYKEAITGVFAETAKEATQVATLVGVLKSETETRERRLAAIKQLQNIQPEIFAGLKLEGDTVIGLDSAYQSYIKNLSNVIAVKIKQLQLERLITKQLESQGATLTKTQTDFIDKLKKQNDSLAASLKTKVDFSGKDIANQNIILESQRLQNKQKQEELTTEKDIAALISEIAQLSKGGVKLDIASDKKGVENIISKAKEIADFLKDAFVITYKFSPLDSKEQALKKAQSFLKDVETGNLKIKVPLDLSPFSEPDAIREFHEEVNSIIDGIRKGIIIAPILIEVPVGLSLNFQANVADEALGKITKQFQDIGLKMPKIDMEATPALNFNVALDALRKYFHVAKDTTEEELDAIVEAHKKGIEQINKAIQGLAVEGFATFGEVLGTALGGGDLKDVFSNFANIVGQGLSAIGKQMIAMAPVIVALKAALKSLNPAILLPAGIALVAIGAALRASIGKGIQGFAGGGLVSGPTLGMIGEGSGTSIHNPEVIAPLDKLKSMLSDLNVGHRQFSVAVTGRLRGRDMLLQNVRTSNSQRRLGA